MSSTFPQLNGYDHQGNWKIPLFCTLGVHIAAIVIAFFGPLVLNSGPRLPEVYTVNLFSVAELPSAPPAAPAPAAAPVSKPTPAPAKTVEPERAKVKVPEPPKPATKPEPIEPKAVVKKSVPKENAVSLKPIPSPTKKDIDKLKEIRQSIHASQDTKKLDKQAEQEVQNALDKIKQSLEASTSQSSSTPQASTAAVATQPSTSAITGTGSSFGGGSGQGKLLEGYMAILLLHLQSHWTLPDNQAWEKGLHAKIVLRVTRDGIVLRKHFEKRSNNVIFDKFVEKTVEDASPLPPFPREIGKNEEEFGLTFWPEGIF